MKILSFAAATAIAFLPLTGYGQSTKNCRPSSPSASPAYQEFMRSDLPSMWSTQTFGPLKPLSGGDFQDCTMGTAYKGFAMLLSKTATTARTIGYASKDGQGKALVFDVTETGTNKYSVKAFDVSGRAMFQLLITNGNISDVQALGPMGCSGVYLNSLVTTIGLSGGFGLVGFGIGMGLMVMNLYDAGCI